MTITDTITNLKKDIPHAVIFQDEKDIFPFKTSNPITEGNILPGGILRPKNVEELQEIIRQKTLAISPTV